MTRWHRSAPLAITIAGSLSIGALAVRRVLLAAPADRGALAGAFALYVCWLVWESRVSVRELERTGEDNDRGTMELAAAAKIGLLLAAFLGSPSWTTPFGVALGIPLVLTGAAFRVLAIAHLGKGYSHRIRAIAPPLCKTGPYGIVRHPAYAGTLIAHAGLVLVFLNPWSLAALVLLWCPAVLLRTALEDRWLLATEEYRAYAEEVRSRLVPGIY